MAELVFDKIYNLTTLEQNTVPKFVERLMIGNEADSNLYQYFMLGTEVQDKKGELPMANYDAIQWHPPNNSITTKQCVHFGMKTMPSIGAVGYYTPVTGHSKLLLPIHIKKNPKYTPPFLTMTDDGAKLHFTITPPEDIAYDCYRILLQKDYFAFEYITYEDKLTIDKPTVIGSYECYCIGYVGEGQYTSEDSNVISMEIDTGTEFYIPVTPSYVTQEVFDKREPLLYVTQATYLADGRLLLTMNDGSQILTNNTPTTGGIGSGGTTTGNAYAPVAVKNFMYDRTSGVTKNINYQGTPGNLLLLFVLSRGDLVRAPERWTLLGKIDENGDKNAGSVDYTQTVHVYHKISTGDMEALSLEQSEDSTFIISIIELSNAGIPIFEAAVVQEDVPTSTTMFTCIRNTTDMYIWFTNSVYFLKDVYTWQVSDSLIWQLPNNGTNSPRLGLFIDRREAPSPFTIGANISGRYASLGAIRITQ